MSEESDIEMKSALPKKAKKVPKSPTADMLKEPKKLTTKEMIHEALVELKTRKGTSLFAIKKYLELKYNVDVDKIKHIIKKYLVSSVEDGTIVQTKGIGASGSFKLVVSKEKAKKNQTAGKTEKKNTEKKEKKEKKDKPKLTKSESNAKGDDKKKVESKSKTDKKENKKKAIKPKKKVEKSVQTPAKKRAAMMKRKSIGSIIKPPKMKPTAKRAAM